MVVTGIFHLDEEESAFQPARADSSAQPSIGRIYEEKIAEYKTLVSMRARNLRQAMLLRELLSQAGAQDVEIDAQAA